MKYQGVSQITSVMLYGVLYQNRKQSCICSCYSTFHWYSEWI